MSLIDMSRRGLRAMTRIRTLIASFEANHDEEDFSPGKPVRRRMAPRSCGENRCRCDIAFQSCPGTFRRLSI